MIISYQGKQSVKVQFGDTVIAFDPISKESKLKATSYGADITLVSLNHPDMNGVDQTSRARPSSLRSDAGGRGEKNSFIIKGPGEYEVQGVFIKGLPSKSSYGGDEMINTIYTVNLENMNICFLGALGDSSLKSDTVESLEGIDILFVPVGGEGVLSPAEAYKLAVSLEPSLVIPINYDDASLKSFLKEASAQGTHAVEKLTIKKKDLEGKESEVVVLESE